MRRAALRQVNGQMPREKSKTKQQSPQARSKEDDQKKAPSASGAAVERRENLTPKMPGGKNKPTAGIRKVRNKGHVCRKTRSTGTERTTRSVRVLTSDFLTALNIIFSFGK